MTREFKADFGFVLTGTVLAFAGGTAPDGWLVCDGTVYDASTDSSLQPLYDAIGNAWGGTDNTDFKVPDLRGEFVRGVDGGTGNDPEAGSRTPAGDLTAGDVGSYQGDEFENHQHQTSVPTGGGGIWYRGGVGVGVSNTGASGGSETRGSNANVLFIIKK